MRVLEVLALALLALVLFGFGYLVGAGHALDLMQQRAVDEGFAVRERDATGEEVFRWRSSEELDRRPARRGKTAP